MRGWSGGGPLGRIGRQCVCHLASRRAPRSAVRLHRNFHVVRWFGRRVALPLAPQAGATSGDGILSDFGVSLLRNGLIFFLAPHSPAALQRIEQIGMAPVLQGLGTALILAIVEQVRDRDEQTQAAAAAEVRVLQARMNPHFLSNALNAIAALAVVAPREIPRAAGLLGQFLRASFDQHERVLVPLEEELALVSAYLDIETLRFGSRLKVEQAIDPGLLKVLIPPFSLQPLVENAVQHGLHSSPRPGSLGLLVRPAGPWLELSVRDDGQGVPRTEIEQVFFAERPRVHALVLLRRRLQGLFGRSFQLEVRSEIGEGTTVTMRLPLRKRLAVGLESPRAITSELRELAYGPADGAPVWRTITAIRTKKSRSLQK